MRYFFDLVDGEKSTDLGGAEYPTDEAARQEAILRALDNRETRQLQGYKAYRCIRVRDEDGRTVCEVAIQG
jgi:hypothetical protein